ncbi:MAG: peptide chain release factor 2 [Planctomycetes bacterium]|nr:peptide chain release factor 2 [Planctomycetota bacterium]
MSTELIQKLTAARSRLEAIADTVQLEKKEKRLKDLEDSMSAPNFWASNDKAQEVIQEVKGIRKEIEPVKKLRRSTADLLELTKMAATENDEKTLGAVGRDIGKLLAEVERVELVTTLSGKHDQDSAFLSIPAGAGGTEACDWVAILQRMYQRWAEAGGYAVAQVDSQPGDEAGLRSATLEIQGEYAYGYLKSEIGVHRLVRISPFDAKNRRHTSFASVDVAPDLPDDLKLEINPADLKIDTFRASGAGGQHVNKTESAVRITHLPTGIVVQCQNERSQHSNRAQAMKLLKGKLIQAEEAKREKELAKMYSEKGEIAWGNQIRSYVLQPYTLVKDHRTGCEVGNAMGVLDGKLEPFMDAYLRWKRKGGAEAERWLKKKIKPPRRQERQEERR